MNRITSHVAAVLAGQGHRTDDRPAGAHRVAQGVDSAGEAAARGARSKMKEAGSSDYVDSHSRTGWRCSRER